jgi:hypothetical protein
MVERISDRMHRMVLVVGVALLLALAAGPASADEYPPAPEVGSIVEGPVPSSVPAGLGASVTFEGPSSWPLLASVAGLLGLGLIAVRRRRAEARTTGTAGR